MHIRYNVAKELWPKLAQFIAILIALIILDSCGNEPKSDHVISSPPSHELWNRLLKEHVSGDGIVNYSGFIEDSVLLNQYLNTLSNNPPNSTAWNENERLAYWINAYNAFTVKLIVNNYPISSIRDLHPTLYVPLLNTVWHTKFFNIGGEPFNLDRIEHDILRKEFDEPRIHFAIVCASYSCPPLRNEAFLSEVLDKQLKAQAIKFINDPRWNKINEDTILLSPIFKWFSSDFTSRTSLLDFLSQYSKQKINTKATVDYLEYNWDLNE